MFCREGWNTTKLFFKIYDGKGLILHSLLYGHL